MAKELSSLEIAGTSVGLANLFTFLGGAVGQWSLGYMLQVQGRMGGKFPAVVYANAFKLYIVCSLLALLMAFLLRDTMAGKVKVQ